MSASSIGNPGVQDIFVACVDGLKGFPEAIEAVFPQTTVTGIPFGQDHPYTYLEAKRLLRLLMAELRSESSLDAVGINRSSEGRPAITEGAGSVWDFLPLTVAAPGVAFTKFPHATVPSALRV